MAGKDMIQDAAQAARERARLQPHKAAEAAGCGPCEIIDAKNVRMVRPSTTFRTTFDGETVSKKFCPTYHVTWVAEYGPIPDPPVGGISLEYSHICHQGCCINPKHGVWESATANITRNYCRVPEEACFHQPQCWERSDPKSASATLAQGATTSLSTSLRLPPVQAIAQGSYSRKTCLRLPPLRAAAQFTSQSFHNVSPEREPSSRNGNRDISLNSGALARRPWEL